MKTPVGWKFKSRTVISDQEIAAGLSGQAFGLDGTTGYVNVPSSPGLNITGQLTIEAWINAQPH